MLVVVDNPVVVDILVVVARHCLAEQDCIEADFASAADISAVVDILAVVARYCLAKRDCTEVADTALKVVLVADRVMIARAGLADLSVLVMVTDQLAETGVA